ncbi:MAG: hypothetical protein OXI05_03170 [Bacteroidota bacterium]|nr:hypothetical protein [Bacteroidota bacterium]MDE2644829.1 hypothetical protein [Bacteroidota bacterium]
MIQVSSGAEAGDILEGSGLVAKTGKVTARSARGAVARTHL